VRLKPDRINGSHEARDAVPRPSLLESGTRGAQRDDSIGGCVVRAGRTGRFHLVGNGRCFVIESPGVALAVAPERLRFRFVGEARLWLRDKAAYVQLNADNKEQ